MQPGFFDRNERLAKLEELGDPLPRIERLVDWEGFRSLLEGVWPVRSAEGGRPPYDAIVMFKVLVLQHLYNLSDDQVEYQIRDRHSFSRFVGLLPEARVPDAKTVWLYRERLRTGQLTQRLFESLLAQVNAAGFVARKGQIVDASIVEAPRGRNTRQENQQIKAGEQPRWSEHKRRQKDTEARWTVKYGVRQFGYKNHLSTDVQHKLIRRYDVTHAAVHDSRVFETLLDAGNRGREVWADAAYHARERVQRLKAQGYLPHLQRQGQARAPLTQAQRRLNRALARVRCKVEHIFGQQALFDGAHVRTVGLERATVKIGLINLVYNLRRWSFLDRQAHQPLPC